MPLLQKRIWMQSRKGLQVVIAGKALTTAAVVAGFAGEKDHRKSECRLKSTRNKPASSEPGFGGGRGGGANFRTAVKNVAVQGKGADVPTPKSTTEQTFSSTSPEVSSLGAEGNSQGTSSSATVEVEKGGAPATSGDYVVRGAGRSSQTDELLWF